MLFNICLVNHGPVGVAAGLIPLIDYMRQSLSKCGHEVTVSHEHLTALDRAKIGLNLTLEPEPTASGIDPRFVSCMRVVEMLDRELLVVSEDIPHDNPYKEYMVSATADDLAVCIKDILQSESWTHLGCLNAAKYREKRMSSTSVSL